MVIAMAIGLISALLFLGFLFRRIENEHWLKSENMPKELLEARLFQSEKPISTASPRKMHGIPDQVYINSSRVLIPVDSKTKKKIAVYPSEIVQMSVYKLILESNGHIVTDYGYFRIVTPNETRYIKKKLLNSERVIFEYDKTKAILNGNKTPKKAHKSKCYNCTQKKNCL